MTKNNGVKALWGIPIVVLATFSLNSIAIQSDSSTALNSAYPAPTTSSFSAYPPPSVNPTPVALAAPKTSAAAQKAVEYIATREGIPVEVLMIEADHPTVYPALRRKFQVVTLIDIRPNGHVYKLLVDLTNNQIEENISALLDSEAQAHESQYGKLQPELHQRLQELGANDALTVAVWMASKPQKTLADLQVAALAVVAAKDPETQAAIERSGKPMDVDDPELAQQIETEYVALISDEMKLRTLPLVTELEQRGFTVTPYEGMPSFTAVLPKKIILELSSRDDVDNISLADLRGNPELDSAMPNSLAPTVWARGINGSGVIIAILEDGNVDRNNSYLNHAVAIRAAPSVKWHTTMVASSAASFHDTYRGTAYGAVVLSAGNDGTETDTVAALQWAFDQGAKIVNFSFGFQEDNNLNWTDRAFDYWARQRFRFITKSAGNTGGSITSPGKGWNVLAVGAYNDNNNLNWDDDQMRPSSAYINPTSPHGDREKPEIVAVGGDVTALEIGNAIRTESGTSLAAPQVAGLAALLIHRNSSLGIWPEAMRAIIMASATHNIEGLSIIVSGQGDLKDGAGAINADLADGAAQVRGTASAPCNSSCWWGDSISNSGFPVGTEITRTFNITTTTLVRVAMTWWAHADTPANNYSFSGLDTDLDLRIKGPDGQYISPVGSLSYDNNYEMVEFVALQPGQYQIAIHKFRADETSNYLGTALVMIPLPYQASLPLIMNNS